MLCISEAVYAVASCVSVCLSVCLSVTMQHFVKVA